MRREKIFLPIPTSTTTAKKSRGARGDLESSSLTWPLGSSTRSPSWRRMAGAGACCRSPSSTCPRSSPAPWSASSSTPTCTRPSNFGLPSCPASSPPSPPRCGLSTRSSAASSPARTAASTSSFAPREEGLVTPSSSPSPRTRTTSTSSLTTGPGTSPDSSRSCRGFRWLRGAGTTGSCSPAAELQP